MTAAEGHDDRRPGPGITRRRALATGAAVMAGALSQPRLMEGRDTASRARRTQPASDVNVGVYVFPGAEELDFAGPWEVLSAWPHFSPKSVDVTAISDTGDPVRCAHGLVVLPDSPWVPEQRFDVFVLPGGNAEVMMESADLRRRLVDLAATGAIMTSVCTGALVYATAGLLDHKPATTHWQSIDLLRTLGEDIRVEPNQRYVDAGQVITAAGVSAGIDMSLYLIMRLDSTAVARSVLRYIQYDPDPPV